MTKNRPRVDVWADKLKFTAAVPFSGTSTRVGDDDRIRYAGFYLLYFADDTYYLGESVNIRGRLGGHKAKWGDEITEVRVLPQNLSKQQLRVVEKKLIHQLEEEVPKHCRNITHASISFGRNELEEYLPLTEQEQWLTDPAAFNAADATTLKPMTTAQAVKYANRARRFAALPDADRLTRCLRTYLDTCVPVPRQTEFQSWSVSAMPSTTRGERALCVSVGRMETLVIGRDGGGFIVVRKSALMSGLLDSARFRLRNRSIRIDDAHYVDAGRDTVTIDVFDLDGFTKLLSDPNVMRAAAQLVIDVMRKHPCVYTRYHCPQLVERAYPEYTREAPEPVTATVAETQRILADPAVAPASDVTRDNTGGLSAQPLPEASGESLTDNGGIEDEQAPSDDIVISWFVNAGPISSKSNTVDDFIARGEWRMDPREKYQGLVQDMLPGERIAVRKRYNTTDVPFENRGYPVSTMDILLTGTITANPGDGCSVLVDWDARSAPRPWYLFTSQDPVWAVPRSCQSYYDDLLAFTFDDAKQDLDYWRNEPYWQERFGDRP